MIATNVLKKSVAAKILSLVAFLSLGLVIVATVAILQMNQIGKELQNIAEKDIPLANALSLVNNHQLEQATLVERIMRLSGLKSEQEASTFNALKVTLVKLEAQVADEISKAEILASKALENAASDLERQEFSSALQQLERIDG
jgi:methyl-accepting chemotaxis protein